jgi:hypothetical protein
MDIRMEAERKAGKLLIEMAEKGIRTSSKDTLARGYTRATTGRPRLSDLSVTKIESHRWQNVAMDSSRRPRTSSPTIMVSPE